ncbi:MAG: endonuclease III [Holosporales bacterium]|nr:endonuclease III [Holosporales bacterium]
MNRPPSKPSESELLLGDTEHRSGVYNEVHEHSSTGSTQQETDCGELGRGSSDNRVNLIFQFLASHNPNPKSELVAKNEYTFCIAVLLSAQATDRAVNKATLDLFQIADSPESMLKLGLDELKKYIKTIGLYNSKASNIIALSEILISQFDSKIPRARDDLEKLPGIGRKSANVILNSLFGEDVIAVDTHVLRVSKRLGLTKSDNRLQVEQDLLKIIPKKFYKNASDWLVLHGRYICRANSPRCSECFLRNLCFVGGNAMI